MKFIPRNSETEVVDVRIREDAPEFVSRSMFWLEGVRVIKEESDVKEFEVELQSLKGNRKNKKLIYMGVVSKGRRK